MAETHECKIARLLMLKAVLVTVLRRVMQDGVHADTILVHHLVNAKSRVEELLKADVKAA